MNKTILKLLLPMLPLFAVVSASVNPAVVVSEFKPSQTIRSRSKPKTPINSRRLSAQMEVKNHKNGTSSLVFKFLNPPTNLQIDKISLQLKQTKPVGPVQGVPSEQVKAAFYNAEVADSVFDLGDPTIFAEIRLYHNPREPYALSVVCLWFTRANSHIEFTAKPRYWGADGNELQIPTTPESASVVLENRLTISPINLRAEPTSSPTGPDCSEKNSDQSK